MLLDLHNSKPVYDVLRCDPLHGLDVVVKKLADILSAHPGPFSLDGVGLPHSGVLVVSKKAVNPPRMAMILVPIEVPGMSI